MPQLGRTLPREAVLFRVVDASQVHVVGQVPEAEAARARHARAAEIEIAGQADRLPAGRLISIGKVLDPHPARCRLRSPSITGHSESQSVRPSFLHLLMDTTPPRPVVSGGGQSWTMPDVRLCSCSAKAKRSSAVP